MIPGVILVGGGGHCRSCIDVLEADGINPIAGVLDMPERVGQTIYGYPVLGTDDMLPALAAEGHPFLITLGQIRSASRRVSLYAILKSLGARLASAVSPLAYVSPRASIGEGTIVMHHAVVNAGAKVGANCIINTKALLEHDVTVGDHCHVSTGAILNGGSRLGARSFLGSHATVHQEVSIGDDCVVAAAACVRKDWPGPGVLRGDA